MKHQFIKMHGLGNDFVIFDARSAPITVPPEAVIKIANRRMGIGCDQLIVLTPPKSPANDAFMSIYNDNGHEVGACGNATRCVGWLISNNGASIETKSGVLLVDNLTENAATAQMGQMKFNWQDIPLVHEVDTLNIDLKIPGLPNGSCTSIGNPHTVFFINDIDIEKYGPLVENHPLFPERTNVEFIQVLDRNRIKMRVWERDVGETLSCGTGACASAAIAHKHGLIDKTCEVISRGGTLIVDLDSDYNVKITGEVAVSFIGQIDL